MSRSISSKSEFYRESLALRMGNRLNQWTFDEFYERYTTGGPASLPKLIGIRTMGYVGMKVTGLYTPVQAMLLMTRHHPESRKWLFDEGAPNEFGTMIGEVMADERGLYLRYVRGCEEAKTHMRRLFEADLLTTPENRIWKHARGLKASMLLRSHMDASSWEFLNDTLREYDGAMVEFLCLSRNAGILNWNTIFWEVRTHY